MISRNLLPGWLRKAIRVTKFAKSFGPIDFVEREDAEEQKQQQRQHQQPTR